MWITVGHLDLPTPHRHHRPAGQPYWIAGITLRGPSHIDIGGDSFWIEERMVTLATPGISYDVQVPTERSPRHEEYYAVFQPWPGWERVCDGWPKLIDGIRAITLTDDALLEEVVTGFRTAMRYRQSGRPRATELSLHAIHHAMMLAGEALPAHQPTVDPRLQRTIDFVREHLTDDISIGQMARVAHLSPSRFAHRFAEEVGLSPKRFLEKLRIDRAKELLVATSTPIHQVGLEVGFRNQFHFSTRFRACVGVNPQAFRRGTAKP